MAFVARDFFERFVAAINERDKEAMRSLIHPEFVSAIIQSGERSRGFDEFWAQMDAYPGGSPDLPPLPETRLLDDEERWAITPAYTVVPLSTPYEFTALVRARYPDGSWWRVVSLLEIRDDKLYRLENYFAPELPAPLAQSMPAYTTG
jgi:hypothetical protein